jgi:hypothetical protein
LSQTPKNEKLDLKQIANSMGRSNFLFGTNTPDHLAVQNKHKPFVYDRQVINH